MPIELKLKYLCEYYGCQPSRVNIIVYDGDIETRFALLAIDYLWFPIENLLV